MMHHLMERHCRHRWPCRIIGATAIAPLLGLAILATGAYVTPPVQLLFQIGRLWHRCWW